MTDANAIRVLLVDDHAVVIEGLSGLLSRSGFEVVATTGDPDEAVRMARQVTPDLAVVDVRLGATSGLDLVPDLLAANDVLRVCVLTSFQDAAGARCALEAGATGFVLKDQPADELCRQLEAVARGSVLIDHRVAAAVLRPAAAQLLTPRELAVLRLVATGANNREVGDQLHLSAHTVKEYLGNAMRKLEVHTRTEAVAVAMRQGLLVDTPSS
ncbi:response regulator [Nitriliruptor alkaliphilus]|uniref:response regulator n=1 Tax=Nitriliruptor alkaliphilus TaxID=427918 RepID=UPI000695E5AF|nr:response regulator transcription factor [Nitriliruptor alkaliphilus]